MGVSTRWVASAAPSCIVLRWGARCVLLVPCVCVCMCVCAFFAARAHAASNPHPRAQKKMMSRSGEKGGSYLRVGILSRGLGAANNFVLMHISIRHTNKRSAKAHQSGGGGRGLPCATLITAPSRIARAVRHTSIVRVLHTNSGDHAPR